jgi:ribosomal protein L7/L12
MTIDPLDEETRQAVIDLLREGRKIEAIKVVRLHTGYGLKQAKDYVDALERELR